MSERRNRGFLTMKDRTVLEESSPDQYPRNFRARTRERLKSGIADFASLSKRMEDPDLMQAFNVLSNPDLTEETSYTHEPFTRETVVDALALFIQAIDLVSDQNEAALEDLIREAVIKAYGRNHPDQLVGAVDLDLETASLRGVHEMARRKHRRGDWLTTTEMRALLADKTPVEEGEQTTTKSLSDEYLSEKDIEEYVLDHLSEIEPGLEVSELQANSQPEELSAPEILCVDKEEKPAPLILKTQPPSRDYLEGLQLYLREYGGADQARLILIIPDTWDGVAEMIEGRRGLEIRELQLDQYGNITGINNPNPS
jgi:hypothetical protein